MQSIWGHNGRSHLCFVYDREPLCFCAGVVAPWALRPSRRILRACVSETPHDLKAVDVYLGLDLAAALRVYVPTKAI